MLSKREKMLAILVATVLGAMVLDRYLVSPLWASATSLAERRQQLEAQLDQSQRMIEMKPHLEVRWQDMVAAGLMDNRAEAESRFLTALRKWSEESGLAVTSIKPERDQEGKDLTELKFVAVGEGPMRAAARFLYLLDSADIPARLSKLQLASRQEGQDSLTVTMHVSTVFRTTPADASSDKGGAS